MAHAQNDDEGRPTLIHPPPPLDPMKSPIENVLELTALTDMGPDVFTNTRPLWLPRGARGIYGGAVIAQSLSAGLRTLDAPKPTSGAGAFAPHSLHCYFLRAGDARLPVIYHVERVRDGRSFATRAVRARQRGVVIFAGMVSFVRENSGGRGKALTHAAPMLRGLKAPEVTDRGMVYAEAETRMGGSPFESRRDEGGEERGQGEPHLRRNRRWMRARGRISEGGGRDAHLCALAYMSDSYFLGTVPRSHGLKLSGPFPDGKVTSSSSSSSSSPSLSAPEPVQAREGSGSAAAAAAARPEVGMMVSLDHSIYFHDAGGVRADEWTLTEMESPWAADGRGLAAQRLWSARDGRLIATCIQEGVVRLRRDDDGRALEAEVKKEKKGEEGVEEAKAAAKL